MTRAEFLAAYCDYQREDRRRNFRDLAASEEATRHTTDRSYAALYWRRHKNWLQNLTVDEWRQRAARG